MLIYFVLLSPIINKGFALVYATATPLSFSTFTVLRSIAVIIVPIRGSLHAAHVQFFRDITSDVLS